VRPDAWTDRFGKLRAELGFTGVRLHDLRHYVATTLLNNGVDLATVAGRLGHGGGGKTTLAIYGHPSKVVDRASSDFMASLIAAAEVERAEDNVVPIKRRG
jgi:integrase